ncbi:unnamed protein product, partial [Bubo scandiacus]
RGHLPTTSSHVPGEEWFVNLCRIPLPEDEVFLERVAAQALLWSRDNGPLGAACCPAAELSEGPRAPQLYRLPASHRSAEETKMSAL